MFFYLTLIIALLIFTLGLIFRLRYWLTADPVYPNPPGNRVRAALKGTLGAIFSSRLPALLKSLIFDVLLQVKTLRQSPYRWIMHMLIWLGFTLLLLMHALDGIITQNIFSDYYPTLNPFLALRDVFGLMVIVGVVMAVARRRYAKQPRLKSTGQDRIILILLAVIIFSGFLLTGLKITSKHAFERMVQEYAVLDESGEQQLEAYWAAEYGLKASNLKRPLDQDLVQAGAEINEFYCASCHSKPQTAPASYLTANLLGPVARPLDQARFPVILWYLHFLTAFAALAYMPFSKFWHIIATPVNLLSNAGRGTEPDPANEATRRTLALDACMHCGACSEICAVGAAHAFIPNDIILPSEKISLLRRLAKGHSLEQEDLRTIVQGMIICTNCNRCGDICPAGIDLQPLWAGVRERLLTQEAADQAYPILLSQLSFYRAGKVKELGANYQAPRDRAWQKIIQTFGTQDQEILNLSQADRTAEQQVKSSAQGFSFAYCYSCRTCTLACPIKDQYTNPQQELGLLPHQIIHATLMGQPELVASSKMLWACLGCYQCQEQCPQGVAVTDVLYELKNLALERTTNKNQV